MKDNLGEFLYSKYVTALIKNAAQLDGSEIHSIIINNNYSATISDVLADLSGLIVTRNTNVPEDSIGLSIDYGIEIVYDEHYEKTVRTQIFLLFDAEGNFARLKYLS